MTRSIYVAATETSTGWTSVPAGLIDSLNTSGASVAVFRPLVTTTDERGPVLESLVAKAGAPAYDEAVGTTYDHLLANKSEAIATILTRYEEVAASHDRVVIVGTHYKSPLRATELALNAELAANLDAPVVLVVPVGEGDAATTAQVAQNALSTFAAAHASVVALVATDALEGSADDALTALSALGVPAQLSTALDAAALVQAADACTATVRTPLAFEHELTAMARSKKMRIVLPESGDDRILTSASIVLSRGTADIVLLGKADAIQAQAAGLGVDVSGAEIVDLEDEGRLQRYSEKLAELRAKKGLTVEQARAKMADPSYFGTMMVYLGEADGMVSGAVNTTANTIRPSLEFVKTKPGVKVVSSSFLMCMPDRVDVYGDCAVNPEPTAEQLADIAAGCAETAAVFGIEPKVAMLSYSTGTSGSGAPVDKVREATELLTAAHPELKVAGPIQFDAAMDPTVGQKKMPGNEVAGNATVFVFPDLNTGNNGYKAVQRTSGAVAVGPVLQGLNKPVNDLSRGALVDDIVNTIAITAIQAQHN